MRNYLCLKPDTLLTLPQRAEMQYTLPVYVRRPNKLIGRDDCFGLYAQGESMMPRYMAGELIVCETKRPFQIGERLSDGRAGARRRAIGVRRKALKE